MSRRSERRGLGADLSDQHPHGVLPPGFADAYKAGMRRLSFLLMPGMTSIGVFLDSYKSAVQRSAAERLFAMMAAEKVRTVKLRTRLVLTLYSNRISPLIATRTSLSLTTACQEDLGVSRDSSKSLHTTLPPQMST